MVGQREFMDVHDAWVRGKSIREIARLTGRDRKTIRRLLHVGASSQRKPRQTSSKLDPFREYLLGRMVGEDAVSNAEVLDDEIREMGYRGGRSILKEFMHPFRALAKEKATVRFETPPGHQAQVDWGTFKKPGRKRVQGFVMTLGWSRTQYLDFTDSQALSLFLACHEQAFHDFGGVPEEILYDRVKTVWLRDDDHGDPVFHPGFVDFAEYYGFRPRLCRAQRPQTKGKTENGIGYVRKNFWPRVRDYRSAHDLLGLRRRLLDETCNVRIHGTTGEQPLDRLPTGHVNASPLMRLHIDEGVDCVLGFGADLAFAGSQLDLAKRVEVGRGRSAIPSEERPKSLSIPIADSQEDSQLARQRRTRADDPGTCHRAIELQRTWPLMDARPAPSKPWGVGEASRVFLYVCGRLHWSGDRRSAKAGADSPGRMRVSAGEGRRAPQETWPQRISR